MKTYQSSTKEKKTKKNFFMRNIYGIIFGATLLVVAAVITLTLVLNASKAPVDNNPGGDINTGGDPQKPVYVTPLDDYTVGQSAALDKLVYSSTLNQWRTHNGIDLLAAAGANVKCVAAGKVEKVENTTLEGTVVTIAHEDGLVSIYKGLSSDVLVKEGDSVASGFVIGTVADTMMMEQREGAHLHLEMKLSGKYVDPANYITDFAADK